MDQQKWLEALDLKYPWEGTYSSIICLTLALSTLSNQMEIGYFIAKQEFFVNTQSSLREDIKFTGQVMTKKRVNGMDYLTCQSEVHANENMLVRMLSTLIRTNRQLSNEIIDIHQSGEFFTTITKEQVYKFSELSGDPNNIHKGEHPVVQGMFLLLLTEDYLAARNRFVKKGEIHYHRPAKADCKLYFAWESPKKLSGIADNIKCFTLTIEEEFIC